jgi:hypothetical protein
MIVGNIKSCLSRTGRMESHWALFLVLIYDMRALNFGSILVTAETTRFFAINVPKTMRHYYV